MKRLDVDAWRVDPEVANMIVWLQVGPHHRWARASHAGDLLNEMFAKFGGTVGSVHSDVCSLAKSYGKGMCDCQVYMVLAPGDHLDDRQPDPGEAAA